MDEVSRRREREAARDGDGRARLRVAADHRRAGRFAEALAATDGVVLAAAFALRAEAHLRLGALDLAVHAGADAEALEPGALDPTLGQELAEALLARPADALGAQEKAIARLAALRRAAALGDGAAAALAHVLADDDPLARTAVARARALGARLLHDPSPLVRFVARHAPEGEAALARRATRDPREDPTAERLFSAHGPDYEFGDVALCHASTEATLAALDPGVFAALDRHLGPGLGLAFSKGYGLTGPPRATTGALRARAEALDASGALPFPLKLDGVPYDPLGRPDEADDAVLVTRYAEDLRRHPGRRERPGPEAPVHRRLLAAFTPGHAPDEGLVEALLAEAEAALAPSGLRALRVFARQARLDARRGLLGPAEKAARAARLDARGRPTDAAPADGDGPPDARA